MRISWAWLDPSSPPFACMTGNDCVDYIPHLKMHVHVRVGTTLQVIVNSKAD